MKNNCAGVDCLKWQSLTLKIFIFNWTIGIIYLVSYAWVLLNFYQNILSFDNLYHVWTLASVQISKWHYQNSAIFASWIHTSDLFMFVFWIENFHFWIVIQSVIIIIVLDSLWSSHQLKFQFTSKGILIQLNRLLSASGKLTFFCLQPNKNTIEVQNDADISYVLNYFH